MLVEEQILKATAEATIKAIQNEMLRCDQVATGGTFNSMTSEVKEDGFVIYSSKKSFGALLYGRKETSNDGSGLLLIAIKEWINAKGLDLNPYAVTNKIHKEGTLLFRTGKNKNGTTPNYENVIKETIQENIPKLIPDIKSNIIKQWLYI